MSPSSVPSQQPSPSRVWVDVTTLFRWQGKWTGIPRTVSCLLEEWRAERPPLCRFAPDSEAFVEVGADELRGLYERQSGPAPQAPAPSSGKQALKACLRASVAWLAPELQAAARDAGAAARHLARYAARLGRQLVRLPRRRVSPPRPPSAAAFGPADVLLSPGGSWEDPRYLDVVAAWKHEAGLRLVPLVYDLIPHKFPQFFPGHFPPVFRRWLSGLLNLSEAVVTISESSRRDVRAFAAAWCLPCPAVEVIRLGDSLPARGPVRPPAELLARGSPPPPFVLSVGTVEVRKNHQLLYHLWRRLAEEHGPAAPPLVVAGRRGWLCDELQYQARNDPLVEGKLLFLEDLDDGELSWLYRHCLFTLYPSHYEGWGLPVCESLAHGKYCIASDRSSLPEIAGDLVGHHDPLDFAACLALVRRALFDEPHRREREEQVRRRYRTTSWADCARRLRAILDREEPSAARAA